MESSATHKGDLDLNFDYSYFRRDIFLSGTTEMPNPQGQETQTHIIGGAATFGLSDNFSAAAAVPLLINRSQNRMMGLDERQTKLGDLTLQLRYFHGLRLLQRSWNIQLAAGATMPLSDGVRNPENDNRNLTSGTVDPNFSVVTAWIVHPGWSVVGSFFTRQIVATTSDGLAAGDTYRYQLGGTFAPVARSFAFNGQLRYLRRGQDAINDLPFPNSGGEWWHAAFGGSRALIGMGQTALRLWGELEVPLHQDVRGNQLAGDWTIRGGLTLGLTILGQQQPTKPEYHDTPAL
ncbi:transporter [Candidatus Zixiibacteriota bacterium]